MEDVFLFFGKENDANELALHGHKVRPGDANGNPIGFPKGLKQGHGLFAVDLDDGGPLVHQGGLVHCLSLLVVAQDVGLLHDGDRLARQSTLVDERAALEDDALEGQLNGTFEEDYVARDQVDGGNRGYLSVAERVHLHLVVGHVVYLVVQLQQFVDSHPDRQEARTHYDERVDVVLLVYPERRAEKQKQIKGSYHFLEQQIIPFDPINLHSPWSERLPQPFDLLLI